MNPDLATIENYLTGQLTSDQRTEFEETLRTNPAVAEALTFYLLTKQAAHDQALTQRRLELNALRTQSVKAPNEPAENERTTPARTVWSAPMRWVAAASIVLLLGIGWYFASKPAPSPAVSQLADQYIATHFNQLPTTMDAGSSGSTSLDRLRVGVGLFNKGELVAAETVFHDILSRQPGMDDALKFAGIAALRRGHYDQAIDQFHQLSQRTDLYANPGTLYEAIAYVKRGQPLDKERAKKLFAEVVSRNLEGKQVANELLTQL